MVLEVIGVHLLVISGALTITISIAAACVICAHSRFTALLVCAASCCLPIQGIQWFPLGGWTAAVCGAHNFVTTLLITPASLGEFLVVDICLMNPFRGTATSVLLTKPLFAALAISTAQATLARFLLQLGTASIVGLAGQLLTTNFACKASTFFAAWQDGAEV